MNEQEQTKEKLLRQLKAANEEICILKQKECEHQQVLEALRRSEQLLDRALHALRDAVFILEAATGKIVNCNIAATSIFGYTRNEFLGNTATFLHTDESSIKEYRRHIYAAIEREGFMHQFEFQMKRKNGEVFPTEHDILPLINAKGIRTGWVSVIRDITQRKKAEQALYESEQKYRDLIDLSPDAIFIIREGIIKMANKAFSTLFSYTEENLAEGLSFLQLAQEKDRGKAAQLYDDRLKGKDAPYVVQFDFINKDNNIIPCEYSAVSVQFENELSELVIVRDITKRRQAEEELRSQRDFAESLIETAQAIILVLDTGGRIVRFNSWMEHVSGYKLEEMRGEDWFRIFLPKREKLTAQKVFLKTMAGVDTAGTVGSIITKDSRELEIEWSSKALKNNDGNIVGILSIGQDITDKRLAQRRSNLLSKAVEQSTEGIAVIDIEGNILFSNQAFAKLHGYEQDEVIGKHMSIFHSPDQMDEAMRINAETKEKGIFKGEVWHLRKDGTSFPAMMNNVVLKDEDGSIIGLLGVMRDISFEKRAREQLQQSEANYKAIFETAAHLIVSVDPEGIITDCNAQIERMLGYAKEEILGRSIETVIHPLDIKATHKSLKDALFKGWIGEKTCRMIRRNGQIINAGVNSAAIKNANGEHKKTICIIEDTTEKTRHIKDLARRESMLDAVRFASEEFLKNDGWHDDASIILEKLGRAADVSRVYIFKNSKTGNGRVKASLKYEWMASEAISRTKGIFSDDFDYADDGLDRWLRQFCTGNMISGHVNDFPLPEKRILCPQEIKSILAAPIFVDGELWGFMGMHEIRWQRNWSYGEEGALKAAADSFSAAIERKIREDYIIKAKKEWESTFDSISDCIAIIDENNTIQRVNKAMGRRFEMLPAELVGKKCYELFHQTDSPPSFCPHEKLKRQGGGSSYTEEFYEKTLDRYFHICISALKNDNSECRHIVHVARDITDSKEMETELIKAHKLDSLGVLAGGIAHDFNNILTAIISNISLAKTEVSETRDMHELLAEAEQAALRAKGLTQQLLTFSKGGAPVTKALLIERLLKDTTEFILRGTKVKAEYFFTSGEFPVEVDAGQISQAIQNIVINAVQAMPKGGVLTVQTESISIVSGNILNLEDGKYIKILIKDEGCGMLREHLDRIFDPYFTTKQRGSGLGLATTYAIIKKHKGAVAVDSEPGRGTKFTVLLPVSGASPDEENADDIEFVKEAKKILVMDDEDFIRKSLSRLFKRHGYSVETAADGEEAIELYKRNLYAKEPFDLVILDITVPAGMGGEETIGRLLELDPNVTAVVSSGYSNNPVMSEFRRYGFKGVLAKPYRTKDLVILIKELFGPAQ